MSEYASPLNDDDEEELPILRRAGLLSMDGSFNATALPHPTSENRPPRRRSVVIEEEGSASSHKPPSSSGSSITTVHTSRPPIGDHAGGTPDLLHGNTSGTSRPDTLRFDPSGSSICSAEEDPLMPFSHPGVRRNRVSTGKPIASILVQEVPEKVPQLNEGHPGGSSSSLSLSLNLGSPGSRNPPPHKKIVKPKKKQVSGDGSEDGRSELVKEEANAQLSKKEGSDLEENNSSSYHSSTVPVVSSSMYSSTGAGSPSWRDVGSASTTATVVGGAGNGASRTLTMMMNSSSFPEGWNSSHNGGAPPTSSVLQPQPPPPSKELVKEEAQEAVPSTVNVIVVPPSGATSAVPFKEEEGTESGGSQPSILQDENVDEHNLHQMAGNNQNSREADTEERISVVDDSTEANVKGGVGVTLPLIQLPRNSKVSPMSGDLLLRHDDSGGFRPTGDRSELKPSSSKNNGRAVKAVTNMSQVPEGVFAASGQKGSGKKRKKLDGGVRNNQKGSHNPTSDASLHISSRFKALNAFTQSARIPSPSRLARPLDTPIGSTTPGHDCGCGSPSQSMLHGTSQSARPLDVFSPTVSNPAVSPRSVQPLPPPVSRSKSTALIDWNTAPLGRMGRPGGVLDRNKVSIGANQIVEAWIHSKADIDTVNTMTRKHPVVKKLNTVAHLHPETPYQESSISFDHSVSRLMQRKIEKVSYWASSVSTSCLPPDNTKLTNHVPTPQVAETRADSLVNSSQSPHLPVPPTTAYFALSEMAKSRNMELTFSSYELGHGSPIGFSLPGPLTSINPTNLENKLNGALVLPPPLLPGGDSATSRTGMGVVRYNRKRKPPITPAEQLAKEEEERPWRGRGWIDAKHLTEKWLEDVRNERISSKVGVDLVIRLYRQVIEANRHHHMFLGNDGARLAVLATRAVVCCVMLDKVVSSLIRHQQSLAPYVEILFRHFMVPDSDDMRDALGGRVDYPVVLQGLGLVGNGGHSGLSFYSTTNSNRTNLSTHPTDPNIQRTAPPSPEVNDIENSKYMTTFGSTFDEFRPSLFDEGVVAAARAAVAESPGCGDGFSGTGDSKSGLLTKRATVAFDMPEDERDTDDDASCKLNDREEEEEIDEVEQQALLAALEIQTDEQEAAQLAQAMSTELKGLASTASMTTSSLREVGLRKTEENIVESLDEDNIDRVSSPTAPQPEPDDSQAKINKCHLQQLKKVIGTPNPRSGSREGRLGSGFGQGSTHEMNEEDATSAGVVSTFNTTMPSTNSLGGPSSRAGGRRERTATIILDSDNENGTDSNMRPTSRNRPSSSGSTSSNGQRRMHPASGPSKVVTPVQSSGSLRDGDTVAALSEGDSEPTTNNHLLASFRHTSILQQSSSQNALIKGSKEGAAPFGRGESPTDAGGEEEDDDDSALLKGLPLYNLSELIKNATPEVLQALVQPFSRKPFFVAHMEVSRKAVLLAHQVRSRQLHFNQLAAIFNFTYMHWTKTLLLTVMRAWCKLCMERRKQEQKKRERWARRRMAECMRIGVGLWRGYSTYVLRTSKKDFEVKAQIKGRKEDLHQIRLEILGLKEESKELDKLCHEKRLAQHEAEESIAAILQKYTTTMEMVREMDRVGTMLLNSLLVQDELPAITIPKARGSRDSPPPPPIPPPPMFTGPARIGSFAFDNSSDPAALTPVDPSVGMLPSDAPNASLSDISAGSLSIAHTEMSMANLVIGASKRRQVAQQQQQLVVALRLLVMWANQKIMKEGQEVEDLLPEAEPPSTAEKKKGKKGKKGNKKNDTPQSSSGNTGRNVRVGGEVVKVDDIAHSPGKVFMTPSPFDPLLDPVKLTIIPVYKFLVLMRCFAPDDLNLPSIALIRTVKVEDEVVVEEIQGAQVRLEVAAEKNSGGGDDESTVETREVDIKMLSVPIQVKVHELSKILHDCYEHLTSSACPVSVEQLATRRRTFYILFLAGLLRHYTNWVVRRLQRDLGAANITAEALEDLEEQEKAATAAAVAAAANTSEGFEPLSPKSKSKKARIEANKNSMALHRGQRHAKYKELSWPPDTHKQWRERVYKHQKWIAVSLSALHLAIDLNTTLQEEPTVEQQEHTNFFLRGITINVLDDLLPATSERTAAFVHIVTILEKMFPRLIFAFRFYAIKLNTVIRLLKGHIERAGSAASNGRRASIMSVSTASYSTDGGSDEEEDELTGEGGDGTGSSKKYPDAGLYITANQFWRLLVDVGVAGNPCSTFEPSPTLHRPAVMSIVEQVVFRALSKHVPVAPVGSSPSLGGGNRRNRGMSIFGSSNAGGPPGGGGGATGGGGGAGTKTGGGAMLGPVPLRDIRLVGKVRQSPHFARAVQESRHVDIRAHRGTICMNLTQFLEALVRCSHCWQCLRAATRLAPASPSVSLSPSRRASGSSIPASATAAAAAAAAATMGSGGMLVSPNTSLTPPAAPPAASVSPLPSGGALPATGGSLPSVMQYESTSFSASLHPQVLENFLGNWIIPKTLNVVSFHSPFRQAMRDPRVRCLLAEWQDALFTVFAKYTTPKEALGIRSALPPPFCRHIAAQIANAQKASEARMSRVSMSVTSQSSSRRRSLQGGAGPRDVGIVGVLTLDGAVTMAKELDWMKESNRITHASIQHCFEEVLADRQREGQSMFFSEFSEFLCAICLYYQVDPTKPLFDKLRDFLMNKVLIE